MGSACSRAPCVPPRPHPGPPASGPEVPARSTVYPLVRATRPFGYGCKANFYAFRTVADDCRCSVSRHLVERHCVRRSYTLDPEPTVRRASYSNSSSGPRSPMMPSVLAGVFPAQAQSVPRRGGAPSRMDIRRTRSHIIPTLRNCAASRRAEIVGEPGGIGLTPQGLRIHGHAADGIVHRATELPTLTPFGARDAGDCAVYPRHLSSRRDRLDASRAWCEINSVPC